MTQGELEFSGGTPAAGLVVMQRPQRVVRCIGAVPQGIGWIAAVLAPVALLRAGPSALLAVVAIALALHAFGVVLRHAMQRLEVSTHSRDIRSAWVLRTWPIP